MFGGVKTIVGLDVGSYSVKAVALQPNKDRLTLQGYAQLRVGDQDQAVVVRQVIDQLGVKPRHAVTAVSGRSVIVRQVETPRLAEAELKSHIAYEADKYIPFGTDEVIIDCQPLPDREGESANNMEVVLVAVRRGFVEDHYNMLVSAGIQPEVIDVDVFAMVNAFTVLGPVPDEEQQGATALVDIGASKSWVAIVRGDRLLFQREIYLAGSEITDAIVRTFNETADVVEEIKLAPGDNLDAIIDAAMPALEDLANEVRLSFDYVEGQFDQEVTRVVLSGGSAQLPTMGELLGNVLGRPVQVFDPLSGIDLVPSRYDLHGLDANAPSLTVALGLACHQIDPNIRGLGGNQLATWQPRRAHASGGYAPPAGATPASGAAAVPPAEDETAAGMAGGYAAAPDEPPPAPYEFSPAAGAAPPAPQVTPPPFEGTPTGGGPLAMPPPPQEDLSPLPAPPPSDAPAATPTPPPGPPPDEGGPIYDFDLAGGEDGDSSGSGRHSTMLVVLDDDDGGGSSEGSGYSRQDTLGKGLDPDADDEDDLPPLP